MAGKFVVGSPSLSLPEWIRLSDEDPVIVSISNPQVVQKNMMKKSVIYEVRTTSKSASSTVPRSYKDFVALKKILDVRFPGACIPALPPEKKLNNKTSEFTEKRAHQLEFFLQAVSENPFLRHDDSYERFVSSQEKFDRSLAEGQRALTTAQSEGVRRWQEALDSVNVKESEKLRSHLAHELDRIKTQLDKLKSAAVKQVERYARFADSSLELYQSFADLYILERDNVQFVSGSANVGASSASVSLPELYLKATDQHMQYAAVMKSEIYNAQALEQQLVDPIRFEYAMARMWKSKLDEIESKLRNGKKTADHVESVKYHIDVLKERIQKGEDEKGKLAKDLDRLERQLPVAIDDAEKARVEAMYQERGVLSIELNRYRASRTIRIDRMIQNIARFHLRGLDELSKVFDGTGSAVRLGRDTKGHLVVSRNEHSKWKDDSQSDVGEGTEVHKKRGKKFSFIRFSSKRNNRPLSNPEGVLESVIGKDLLESRQMRPANMKDQGGVELRACEDYAAQKRDELDVSEGEILTGKRVENVDHVWFATNKDGQSGIVPASVVQVKSSTPMSSIPTVLLSPRGGDSKSKSTFVSIPPPPPPGDLASSSKKAPTKPVPPPGLMSSLQARSSKASDEKDSDDSDNEEQEERRSRKSSKRKSHVKHRHHSSSEEEDEEEEKEKKRSSKSRRSSESSKRKSEKEKEKEKKKKDKEKKEKDKDKEKSKRKSEKKESRRKSHNDASKRDKRRGSESSKKPSPLAGGAPNDLLAAIGGFNKKKLADSSKRKDSELPQDSPKARAIPMKKPSSPLEELRLKLPPKVE